MTKLLLKLPWFASAPLVVLLAGAFAWLGYAFTGDYFNETCKNERNLLTGEFEPSNCGEGAKVVERRSRAGQATPGASVQAGAASPGVAAGSPAGAPPSSGIVAKGSFRDGAPGHTGKGTVEIQRLASGKLNVFLSNFSVTNGPDLFVVLGKAPGGDYGKSDFTVAKLKANNGNQNYEIAGNVNPADYRTVLIWCKSFDIVFAYAPLEEVRAAAPPAQSPVGAAGAEGAATVSVTPATAAPRPPTPIPANTTTTISAGVTPTPPPGSATTPTAIGAQITPTAVPGSRITPTPASGTPTAQTQGPGVLARGAFRDGAPGHTGSGNVEIQRLADGSLNLFLSGFSVTNGPDLFVVLGTGSGGDYSGSDLTIAKLKANNGSQNYALPPGTDVSRYRTVLIWCRQFTVVFAYAPIGAN